MSNIVMIVWAFHKLLSSSLSEAVRLFSLFEKKNTYNLCLPLYRVPKSISGNLNAKTKSSLITTQSGNGSCSELWCREAAVTATAVERTALGNRNIID